MKLFFESNKMGDNPQVNKITKKIAASEMEKDPNNNQEGSNEHLEEGRRYWLLKKLQESAEKNMRLEKRVRQKLRTFVVIFVLCVAVAFAFIILQKSDKNYVSLKFEYFIIIVGELGVYLVLFLVLVFFLF